MNDYTYSGLTLREVKRLGLLRMHLFGNDKFVIFTQAEIDSPDYKEYDGLVKKRMDYLRNLHTPVTRAFLPSPTTKF